MRAEVEIATSAACRSSRLPLRSAASIKLEVGERGVHEAIGRVQERAREPHRECVVQAPRKSRLVELVDAGAGAGRHDAPQAAQVRSATETTYVTPARQRANLA